MCSDASWCSLLAHDGRHDDLWGYRELTSLLFNALISPVAVNELCLMCRIQLRLQLLFASVFMNIVCNIQALYGFLMLPVTICNPRFLQRLLVPASVHKPVCNTVSKGRWRILTL